MFVLDPWYLNFFNNIATVQFDHRADRVAARDPRALVLGTRPQRHARRGAPGSRPTCCSQRWPLQIALGIATLLLVVPIPLAAAHQAGALLVFTAALFAAHRLR